jgi:hypothetical protein
MQPGNPGQDPYGQQNPNDPTAPADPYRQPPQPPPAQPYGQPGAGEPPYGGGPGGAGPGAPNNTLGLLALVFGIAAVPLGLCCGLYGAPFGIAAIVLGYLGKNKADQGQATNRSQAMTGLILGVVGIVVAIVNVALGQLIDWSQFTNQS